MVRDRQAPQQIRYARALFAALRSAWPRFVRHEGFAMRSLWMAPR